MAIRQKGSKWQVDVTVKGVRAPRVSRDTRAEAEAVEADFKARLLRGENPDTFVKEAPKATAKGTLGGVLNATYKARWAGAKAEASSLRNGDAWCLELGYDLPVADLTYAMVVEVCDRWAVSGNKPGTINRKLAALRVMLKEALKLELLDRVIELPKKKEYEGRLRYYEDDEVESLIDYVDGELKLLFTLAVETGMRQSELLGLIARDVDMKRGLLLLGMTKGDKRRSVPLTTRAKEVVKTLTYSGRKMSHEPLFETNITCRSISRVISTWKAGRGLPKEDEACFHTFRHTCCSRLVQRGVPIVVVQKWMGHATIQTTMRYAHLAPDSLDIALAALEGEET